MAGELLAQARPSRVEFFALGDRALASSRVRAWQLSDELRSRGVNSRCVVGPSPAGAMRALALQRCDVIVVQKWTAPPQVLAALRRRCRMFLFDVDDAIYLDTGRGGSLSERNRMRLLSTLALFDAFTVSTKTIADDLATLAPDTPALVYPGPIRPIAPSSTQSRRGVIWLGSPATERYLSPWSEGLARIDRQHGFVAIGARPEAALGIPVQPWSPHAESSALAEAAVGVFVQADGTWEDRKSGYKLLEYISHGVLPVAERRAAAVELLGSDYPYLFDGDLEGAVGRALRLDRAAREAVLDDLRTRIAPYSYSAVVERWSSFAGNTGGRR